MGLIVSSWVGLGITSWKRGLEGCNVRNVGWLVGKVQRLTKGFSQVRPRETKCAVTFPLNNIFLLYSPDLNYIKKNAGPTSYRHQQRKQLQ